MVKFSLKGMDKFARAAFQVDLEEMTLFRWEWVGLYDKLAGALGELEIKRRTAIEVRYGLLEGDERLKDYKPMKSGLYPFRVVAEVLAKMTGKDGYSRDRASQLVVDGFVKMRRVDNRTRIFSQLSFGKEPISFCDFFSANSGIFHFGKGVYSPFTGSENCSRLFDLPISVLDLSVRAANCLEADNIKTIGELVQITEPKLLGHRNFGRRFFNEVKDKLEKLGLSLGMTF